MSEPGGGLHDLPGVVCNKHQPILNVPYLSSGTQATHCAFFEQNYWKCMSAFGMQLGKLHCQLEARDLTECTMKEKTWARAEAMRNERLRQLAAGERDRAFNEPAWVRMDTRPDYFDANPFHAV